MSHIWLEFALLLSSINFQVGTSETANAVYWRARKMLKDTAELVTFTYLR